MVLLWSSLLTVPSFQSKRADIYLEWKSRKKVWGVSFDRQNPRQEFNLHSFWLDFIQRVGFEDKLNVCFSGLWRVWKRLSKPRSQANTKERSSSNKPSQYSQAEKEKSRQDLFTGRSPAEDILPSCQCRKLLGKRGNTGRTYEGGKS